MMLRSQGYELEWIQEGKGATGLEHRRNAATAVRWIPRALEGFVHLWAGPERP